MLKHRVNGQRRRHHSQGSEVSYEYNASVGWHNHPPLSPASISSASAIQPSVTATSSTFSGCFGGNKWSSAILSGGGNPSPGTAGSQHHSDDETDGSGRKSQQRFRMPRRTRPFSGGSGSDNPTDVMRRWNSFHSTRGECHPNRFKKNRKSTSPNIDSSRMRKNRIQHSVSIAGTTDTTIIPSASATDSNTGCSGGLLVMPGRNSVVQMPRHSVCEDPQLITKHWQLRRGKSLVEGSITSRTVSQTPPGSPQCFGKRNGGSVRRPSECFVLETSEMIVIDYPEVTQASNLINPLHYHIPTPLGGGACPTSISGGGCGVGIGVPTSESANNINNLLNSSSGSTTPTGATTIGNNLVTTSTTVTGSGIGVSIGGGGGNSGGVNCGHLSHHYSINCGAATNINISAGGGYHQHHRNSAPVTGGSQGSTVGNAAISYRQQLASVGGLGGIISNSGGCVTPTGINMDHHHMRHTTGFPGNRPELYQKCNRGSHSSDTSSAYSGSDTMTSVHSSSLDVDEVDLSGLVESVVDSDEEDLAESMDSLNVRDGVRDCLEKDPSDRTEDDIKTLLDFTQTLKAFTNMTLAVRRALCSVMVFAVVDKAGTMVMSDGEELDSWSVLINGHVEIEHSNGDKEELQVGDSFGILPTMDKLYHRGVMRTKCDDCQFVCITQTDYYRIQHQGEENTKRHEEEGQLVMVTELRHSGTDTSATLRRGHVVIRGTPDRLMLQLIEENSMTDPTYVEDFLLTHRTFIDNPQSVAKQLLQWFEHEDTSPQQTTAGPSEIRDRVTRVVLLWVNNHFTDFETDTQMMEFLEKFEAGLEKKAMLGQLRLLHIACAAKARTRNVTLARPHRDENLHFTIIGETNRRGYGIFISKVDKNTKAEDVGLKRGDQILEMNGQSFEHVTLTGAMELLMSSTHLSITVKSNLLSFKEMLQAPDNNSPRPRQNRRRICASDIAKLQATSVSDPRAAARLSTVELLSSTAGGVGSSMSHDQVDCCAATTTPMKDISSSIMTTGGALANSAKKDPSTVSTSSTNSSSSSSSSHKGGFMTLGPKRRIQKALIKMNLLPKNSAIDNHDDDLHGGTNPAANHSAMSNLLSTGSNSIHNNNNNNSSSTSNSNHTSSSNNNQPGQLYHSHSNPDLTTVYYEDTRTTDYPEHVLKVYKSDQTCKYLLINKETTAHEVVMLALQEFGNHETSSNFSLCEVSVGEGGMIKQRRLPERLQNLAERIGLCSRYYLKTNGVTDTLVPDDMAPDLIRESTVHFLQLNANELAIQLTFQDFAIFRQIESTEYVDDLFELKSKYGIPMLRQFAELVNREMFWVVTEVCSEHNMVRRMKIVKQFIKIARHCKECRNFNSMFAIISGLGHAAVSRLRLTWEKLPTKYQKLFTDLQDLMDPSRNMSKYRQLVSAELLAQHPIIPFYPVVKKDLTFIHLGNDTRVEGLINFEKLRMIAKEVRILTHMCSAYDLLSMLEFKGQPPSPAMVALNQMSVSSGPHTLHGQATVKRRKKSTAAPNPKKMFEEAQMVRRVKAYLNNIKVITDEDALHTLSLECEPSTSSGGGSGSGSGGGGGSGSGSAPNSVTIRKRHPSPTLSTTSSTSSTSEGKKGGIGGPKFGAASPQAVKKILSLSEQTKTRPHQPRHPGIPLPLVGHPHALHHQLHHSSISPSPSPGAHRRMGSSSSAGGTGRAVHERSHSDTPNPLPSVDLSLESSSVTSLSNLPLRKTITSGSATSSDSGHSSCVQGETHSNCCEGSSGLYHVASSIVHNSPSPTLQQRRHSAIHAPGVYLCSASPTSSSSASTTTPPPLPPHHPLNASIDGLQPPTIPSSLNSTCIGSSLLSPNSILLGGSGSLVGCAGGGGNNINCNMLGGNGNSNNCGLGPGNALGIGVGYGGGIGGGNAGGTSNNSSQVVCGTGNCANNSTGLVGNGSIHGGCIVAGGNGTTIVGGSGNNGCGTNMNSVSIGSTNTNAPNPLQRQMPAYSHMHSLGIATGCSTATMQPPPPPHPASAYAQHNQTTVQYHTTRTSGHGLMAPPPPKGPRHPPSYNVAAKMARMHRLGRAHSHEGVTSNMAGSAYYHPEPGDEDDDEDTQVSAV